MTALLQVISLFREAYREWKHDNPTMIASSLSYFAMFALVPTLLISLTLVGHFFQALVARQTLLADVATWFTPEVSAAIRGLLSAADKFTLQTTFFTFAFLLWASMRLFTQLQDALNLVWDVKVPRGYVRWFKSRFRAVLMIGALSLVVFIFLSLDIAFAIVKKPLLTVVPSVLIRFTIPIVTTTVSFVLFTVLFAIVYKLLPERRIPWHDVWVGAFVSSSLFGVARWLLSFYFSHSPVMSIYGAAGSVLILLVWVYFSMQILIFGAAFTRAYSQLPRRRRHAIGLERPV